MTIPLEPKKRVADVVPVKIRVNRSLDVAPAREETKKEPARKAARAPRTGKNSRRRLVGWIAGSIALIAVLYGAIFVLPKATVKIVAAKTPVKVEGTVLADKTQTKLDLPTLTVPGQVFSQQKNIELRFPTTGKKFVARRATGTITIYNNNGSESQSLVATTRFATPDGKIFRLAAGVLIPGAKTIDGKLIPASIDADVYADGVGPTYNIPPVSKFTIPGFAGTPKFETFFAESKHAMTGGANGEVAFPSLSEIAAAKATSTASLESVLTTLLLSQMPPGFKLLDGARQFSILKQTVQDAVMSDGTFGVTTEAQLSIMVFKEDDIAALLGQKVAKERGNNLVAKTFEVTYGAPRYNSGVGIMEIPITYVATMVQNMDSKAIQAQIAGKSEADLKTAVFSIPGVESAQISLWPFWVRRVPKNLSKVHIAID